MYTIDNSLLLGFGAEKRPKRTSSGKQSGSSRFALRDPAPRACGFGCGGADPMVDGGFGKRDPVRPGCGSGGGCVGQCEEVGETSCGKRGAKSFVDAGAMDWGIQLRDGGAIAGTLGGGGLGGAAGPFPPADVAHPFDHVGFGGATLGARESDVQSVQTFGGRRLSADYGYELSCESDAYLGSGSVEDDDGAPYDSTAFVIVGSSSEFSMYVIQTGGGPSSPLYCGHFNPTRIDGELLGTEGECDNVGAGVFYVTSRWRLRGWRAPTTGLALEHVFTAEISLTAMFDNTVDWSASLKTSIYSSGTAQVLWWNASSFPRPHATTEVSTGNTVTQRGFPEECAIEAASTGMQRVLDLLSGLGPIHDCDSTGFKGGDAASVSTVLRCLGTRTSLGDEGEARQAHAFDGYVYVLTLAMTEQAPIDCDLQWIPRTPEDHELPEDL